MVLQQAINAIMLGSIFALFALGLSLAWGTLDVLNLAHGAMFVFGGFVAFELTRLGADMPFVVLVLAGMASAGIAAVALERVAFGPIRRRFTNKRQAELSMLAVTIGAGIMLDQIVNLRIDEEVFPVGAGAFTIERYDLGLFTVSNIQILVVVVAAVVAVALDIWVRRARQGMAVRAIAYSPNVASLLGINVNRVATATMLVSGALAGLAGVLLGVASSGLSIETGHALLIKGFAVLVVGGVGSVRGAVAAAYLVGAAEVAVVAWGPGTFRDAVAFGLIILVLLLRPQGLFARREAVRA